MNWNNITIGQYQKIVEKKAKGLELLSIATDLTVKELENLPLSKLTKLTEEYIFLNDEPPPDNTKNWGEFKILDFNIKGGASQIIDFLSLLDDNNYIGNLHLIMATLCNDGKEYNFQDKAKMFRDEMPITVAFGVAGFFLQNFSLSERNIPFYLEQAKKGKLNTQNLIQRLEDLKLNINGISGSID